MDKKGQAVVIGIVIVVAIIAGFFFLRSSGEVQQPTVATQDQAEAAQGSQDQDTTQEQEPQAPEAETKTFDVIARQWDFNPNTITVNEGDNVILNVKSIDVAHGLAITAFGVNERLNPGTTTRIEFTADKKGTYSFFCSVFCGRGHSTMKGTLVVN